MAGVLREAEELEDGSKRHCSLLVRNLPLEWVCSDIYSHRKPVEMYTDAELDLYIKHCQNVLPLPNRPPKGDDRLSEKVEANLD